MRSGADMLGPIVDQSALGPDCRQQLLADPKAAISGELGITVPAATNIQIHESDMQTGVRRHAAGPEHHQRATRSGLGRPLLLPVTLLLAKSLSGGRSPARFPCRVLAPHDAGGRYRRCSRAHFSLVMHASAQRGRAMQHAGHAGPGRQQLPRSAGIQPERRPDKRPCRGRGAICGSVDQQRSRRLLFAVDPTG